jgi:hypothetical protein
MPPTDKVVAVDAATVNSIDVASCLEDGRAIEE